MQVDLVIMMTRNVSATSEDDYESRRDQIINDLEEAGWNVNVEAEETVGE